jgi:hypothetical protein
MPLNSSMQENPLKYNNNNNKQTISISTTVVSEYEKSCHFSFHGMSSGELFSKAWSESKKNTSDLAFR